jgi:hypothetical protein
MTTDQFTFTADDIIDLLPIVANRGWRVSFSGAIRDRDGRCPVCALVHEVSGGALDEKTKAWNALQRLGFRSYTAYNFGSVHSITLASDIPFGPLRDRLEQALGMRPEVTR